MRRWKRKLPYRCGYRFDRRLGAVVHAVGRENAAFLVVCDFVCANDETAEEPPLAVVLLFMKVYQVKHSAGKKDRPGNWNVTPPGDIITPLPGIPEIKQEEVAEKQQPVEEVPSRILGILQKISRHWYRNTISMRSPYLQQMV